MTDMLKAAVALGLVLVAPLAFGRGKRLLATILTSPFQLHVPGFTIGGFYPPIALLSAWSLWPDLLRAPRSILRWPPFLTLVLLGLMFGISLSWSAETRVGIRSIVYLGAFLATFVTTYVHDRFARIDLARLTPWLFAPVVLEACLVFLYAASPDIEAAFMSSEIARLFINPNTLEFDRTTWADPQKSGGLIINANVAGTYLGMCSVTCAGLAFGCRRPILYGVAALLWLSLFFTGSKASVLLAASIPVVGYGLLAVRGFLARRRVTGIVTAHLVASLVLIALVRPTLLPRLPGALSRAAEEAPLPTGTAPDRLSPAIPGLGERPVLWAFGWDAFERHPVRGLGFGGWDEALEEADLVWETMPPLNTVLDLWSKAGLVAATLGIAFMIAVTWFGLSTALRVSDRETLGVSVGMLLSFSWMFVQGMVENFGLFGEVHMAPVAAAMLGLTRSRVEGANAASAGRA